MALGALYTRDQGIGAALALLGLTTDTHLLLLDSIIVRSVLVTALNLDVGRWMWWPGKLAQKPDPAPGELSRERAAATVAS